MKYYIVYEQRQMSIYAQNRGKHFMYYLALLVSMRRT